MTKKREDEAIAFLAERYWLKEWTAWEDPKRPDEILLDKEKAEAARWLVSRLDNINQRLVLVMLFGLCGSDEATTNETGAALGVGAGRVRQIEAMALRRLRVAAGCYRPREVVRTPWWDGEADWSKSESIAECSTRVATR